MLADTSGRSQYTNAAAPAEKRSLAPRMNSAIIGSGRTLQPFPTRRGSAIFPPIVRLNGMFSREPESSSAAKIPVYGLLALLGRQT
jgi:hypothetical protein